MSRNTFSGAEEFTYNLKTRKRATIIGETTRGGANPCRRMPIDQRFELFVPVGRAINPVTMSNWEGSGIAPDVACAAADALTAAMQRAKPAAAAHRESRVANVTQQFRELQERLAAIDAVAKNKQWPAACEAVTSCLRLATDSELWLEFDVNELGYAYLKRGDAEIAIAAFAHNVVVYPASSNAFDSLGEAYMAAGKRQQAIVSYRRSIKLDPRNSNATRMLEELTK
ncbi:MAG: tetratricopeptide (TPR) repeat protein [Planctomycetota bacterium]|jgi:tetratricopeptide (TPR) repeat protein